MNEKASDLVYSYRLTCFDGTAPCDDYGKFTLAICKRDMRRVIGREFHRRKKDQGNIWFIGLMGKELKKTFPEDPHSPGEILYLAKLTGVKSFYEYFSENGRRKDQIYAPVSEIHKGKREIFETGGRYFHHNGKTEVHRELDLQERDWDVQHGGKELYVLESEEYTYIEAGHSINRKLACYPLASGVGHRKFETEGYIRQELEDLVEAEDHRKENCLKISEQEL